MKIKCIIARSILTAMAVLAMGTSILSANEITIGTQLNLWNNYPLSTSSQTARTQTIYRVDEIENSGLISSLALNIIDPPLQAMSNFTIRMKHTSLSAYQSSTWESDGWITVYQASEYITTSGWWTFNFHAPFFYNGRDNLMIDFSFSNAWGSIDGNCACSSVDSSRTLFSGDDGTFGSPLTWSESSGPAPDHIKEIPNIKLALDPETSVITPQSSLQEGAYNTAKDTIVTSLTEGAVIHYTTNGTDPTQNDPVIASGGSVHIGHTLVFKAKAWKEGMDPSGVRSVHYTIPTAASPVFSVNTGKYHTPQNVTVTCSTPGATIHYTTNGNDPTETDPVIASGSSILVDKDLTLKANAWLPGVDSSPITTAVFTFEAAVPAFSPNGGSFGSAQDVVVTCSTPQAVIHYTTNGAVPTEADPIIDSGSSIHIATSTPLKAKSWRTGWQSSTASLAVFVISGTPVAICVSPTGNDLNDGLTWATAKKSITAAINFCTAGMEIWVASGTYTGGIDLKSGVSLYGGFAGNETDRTQRNWTLNKSIINGSSGSAVVVANNVSGSMVFDGFTVQNGNYLGGILCLGGSPVISNNTLTLNSNQYGWGGYMGTTMCGGGINLLNSNATLKDNTITQNSAFYQGGGIYVIGGSPVISNNIVTKNTVGGVYVERSSATINGNTISNNTANYHGGGLSVFWCTSTVSGNTIENNQTTHVAGGIDLAFGGNVTVTGNVIRGNVGANCGGIWLDGNSYSFGGGPLQATISNNIIDNNSTTISTSSFSGGGIASMGPVSQLIIQGNQITRNISTGYGGGGVSVDVSSPVLTITGNTISDCRAARNGGGISVGAAATIGNNIITNNAVISPSSSTYGGGIYSYANSNIHGNKIIGNAALVASSNTSYGGGIYLYQGKALNNVVLANGAIYGGGIYSLSSQAIVNNSIVANTGAGLTTSSTTAVTNNLVAFNSLGCTSSAVYKNNNSFGNKATNYPNGISGTSGNISADPNLADLANGNIHLMQGSPCIDTGLYTTLLDGSTDMDGQARVIGSAVDIGADESNGTSWLPGPYCEIRVSTSGDDANDGLTWATAKKTIQAAIDSAALLGGEVWVAAGSYAQPITLRPFVYLYGGFAGTESSIDQRNWNSNVSIINGNLQGSAVKALFGGPACLIDGFTITRGNGNQLVPTYYYGGGICSVFADMTVRNCRIISNSSSYGGGIYTKFSSPTITCNLIAGNNADAGAAILSDLTVPNTPTSGSLVCNTISDNVGRASSSTLNSVTRLIWSSGSVANNIIAYNTSGPYITNPAIAKSNNCFKNGYNSSIIAGVNSNISVDPVFVNRATGDYRLSPVSACIDAGDSSAVSSILKDLAGSQRILGGSVDIGAFECSSEATSILDAKLYHPNLNVNISSAVITAAFPDFFYIESENRICGIRVEKTDHGLSSGMKVSISGKLATLDTRESAILATTVQQLPGTGTIAPLGMANRQLGGGPFGYQVGLTKSGVSNLGLLVNIWGVVTLAGRGWFYIDDGSRVKDGSGVTGIYVDATGLKAPSKGSMVRVTGISSCDLYNDTMVNTLLVSRQSDIQTAPTAQIQAVNPSEPAPDPRKK